MTIWKVSRWNSRVGGPNVETLYATKEKAQSVADEFNELAHMEAHIKPVNVIE